MPASTGSAASSTIVQPVGSQSRPSILTRASQGVRKVFFAADDLSDPSKLYQVIHAIQQNLSSALRVLSEDPQLSGILLRGVVLTGGTALPVPHGLGRAYQGYTCVGTHGVAWTGFASDLPLTAFPGLTAAKAIVLTNPSSGTFDFWVF